MDAFCKALFLGGVTRRFPRLAFGLLEGGVALGGAAALPTSSATSRSATSARSAQLDPARIDVELRDEALRRVRRAGASARTAAASRERFTRLEPEPPELDEWRALGAESEEELVELFVPRFYFGCEADDPTVALGLRAQLLPGGRKLRAMFSSDLGHWDVPDMGEILLEAPRARGGRPPLGGATSATSSSGTRCASTPPRTPTSSAARASRRPPPSVRRSRADSRRDRRRWARDARTWRGCLDEAARRPRRGGHRREPRHRQGLRARARRRGRDGLPDGADAARGRGAAPGHRGRHGGRGRRRRRTRHRGPLRPPPTTRTWPRSSPACATRRAASTSS